MRFVNLNNVCVQSHMTIFMRQANMRRYMKFWLGFRKRSDCIRWTRSQV